MWEDATPFENQEELSEPERFYMNELVRKGNEVRYDEKCVYNRIGDSRPATIGRIFLVVKNDYAED